MLLRSGCLTDQGSVVANSKLLARLILHCILLTGGFHLHFLPNCLMCFVVEESKIVKLAYQWINWVCNSLVRLQRFGFPRLLCLNSFKFIKINNSFHLNACWEIT